MQFGRLFNELSVQAQSAQSSDLLAQARAGDAEAFGQLCCEHEARLFRQAMALCGNPARAEDLAQDTLVAAWRSMRRYRGQCLFFTWLCSILIHLHRNIIRKKHPVSFSSLTAEQKKEAMEFVEHCRDSGVAPDELLALAERECLLRSCLDQLPQKQRDVVYLRFYVDTSLAGIAAALGCSVGTVKSRLFNGLDRLAKMQELKKIQESS